MNDHFKKLHQGIYCGTCDVKNHQFFNIELQSITYTRKMCRDIV